MGLPARMRGVAARRRPARPSTGSPPLSSFFVEPRGCIDAPSEGQALSRAPVHIRGWCLIPGSTVARVEISVDDAAAERARLGIERLDVRDICSHPDAPVCGFEHKVDLACLPASRRAVTIEAVAHAVDGRRLELEPLTLPLAAAAPAFEDDARGAELRRRSLRHVRRLQLRDPADPTGILVFTHQLDYSGGSRYLFEVLRRLSTDARCEVAALADGPLREEFEHHGIPVHLGDPNIVSSVERYEANQAELVAWAAVRGFDVALVNTVGSFAGADAATRLGLPVVWAIHESFTLPEFWMTAFAPGVLHPYVRTRAESALAAADAVVFEAEATRRLYLPHASPERLLTMPYGIELDAVAAARRAITPSEARRILGVPDGRRLILCLGTIEARKSQSFLVEAFAQVADRHPDTDLALVGETDAAYCADYSAALRDYVKRADLSSRVRIEPVTSDPFPWHIAADLLVCSSDIESLPRVILEAMAFGTPVLSTRVFGVPELIEDGRTGYLCEPRDVGELARGLDRVLRASPPELAAVTDAAAERVRERHDPAVYASALDGLLRRTVAGRALDEPRRAA